MLTDPDRKFSLYVERSLPLDLTLTHIIQKVSSPQVTSNNITGRIGSMLIRMACLAGRS